MVLAEIIINRPTKQLNKPFTYSIPADVGRPKVGTRVAVPLGPTKEEGILIKYIPEGTKLDFTPKPIIGVLEEHPWFTLEMLETARKISEYYLCSYSEALSLFTIDKKHLKSYERPKEKWLIPLRELTIDTLPKKKRKQRELVAFLLEHGEQSVSTLKTAGYSLLVIKQVMELPSISVEERYRDTHTNFSVTKEQYISLTDSQKACVNPILKAMEEKIHKTFLLHGVTGSGKTQVYMYGAQQCIEQDTICMVLVPEIVLTNQIVERFVRQFGSEVVVFHSKLTIAERYNNWERLRRKDSHIIIGARSAIFGPTDDIGLIILDEEHDTSYKQEDMIRYHARNVALWRGEAHKCPVLLGSATPSMESYYKAKQGEYTLLTLKERIFKQPLPDIQIVDMKEEMFHHNYSVFSRAMEELIRETLQKQEQMILLLNRRGHSTFILCRDCGKSVECPHCDVSMVYHSKDEDLKCHYCEHHEPIPTLCPHCKSKRIKFFGSGTQKVEETLRKDFPHARVARLDQDMAKEKGYAEKILEDFKAGKYDILLGTQMVSKGHDFQNVTAVGVLTADSVLHIPLYSAAERTFDLLTQTAGRAGRGTRIGKAVFQTYSPLHYAIQLSKMHDYEGFYKEEIVIRNALQYPPIGSLIHMVVQHKDRNICFDKAENIVKLLNDFQEQLGIQAEILGPYEGNVRRVRNLYRLSIMIRGCDLTALKKCIYNSSIFTEEGVYIDVDPV